MLNKEISMQEARTHIEILTELLRDIDIEKRMETLIKADGLLKEGLSRDKLLLIREDLEGDLMNVKKMIFMVEKAQDLIGA